jgi:hypothetical protein
MKPLNLLVVLLFAAVIPCQALADDPNTPDTTAGTGSGSSTREKKYGVPPGMMKKGALPRSPVKQHEPEVVPGDVLITNESGTDLVIEPRPAAPAAGEDDKRVQSPRGAEVLPQSGPVTLPVPKPAPPSSLQPATPRQERELEAQLLQVIVSKTNPGQRNAALRQIASETGTTLPALEDQLTSRPKLSGGDLLMGNKIASLSKTPADTVFAAHDQTGLWLATGERFGVAPATLQETATRFVNSGR